MIDIYTQHHTRRVCRPSWWLVGILATVDAALLLLALIALGEAL